MDKPKILAYYLPQFHPFPENDEWWGKGFTEWTNVGKAKPLYKGHYQPKVPGELGYYDLRLKCVREEQAVMAREACISGFCYWHYWFEGHELMEMPFTDVVNSGHPEFPFCLGWANETWKSKMWNKDGSLAEGTKTLIEQTYGGASDNLEHFNRYKSAFADRRYVRIDGRPFFLIYRPLDFKGLKEFMAQWNELLKESGIAESFYFVAHARNEDEVQSIEELGFDAINIFPLERSYKISRWQWLKDKVKIHIIGIPRLLSYDALLNGIWNDAYETKENVLPTLIPNWDHSPRSGKNALILDQSTPDNWRRQVRKILSGVSRKNNKLIMLKSWNEWGEGNYLEPDYKYGKAFLDILKEEMGNY